jgi:CO dehydrogenase/acetyl-CoA synthase alpha subunit
MRSSCKAFSQLVIKVGEPLVGGTIPGLVVLSSIRKQAEKNLKKKKEKEKKES